MSAVRWPSSYILPFLVSIPLALASLNGCESSSNPTGGTNIGSNISVMDFPADAGGGDPRGTYTPNTPFMRYNFSIPGMNIATTEKKNTGSGTMKFEGSSANEGDFLITNITLDVEILFTVVSPQGVDSFTLKQYDTTASNSFGTWKTIDQNRIVLTEALTGNRPDTIPYTANAKGFFMHLTAKELSEGMSGTMAFKRQ